MAIEIRNGCGCAIAMYPDDLAQSPRASAVGSPKEKIRIEPVEVPVPSKTPAPVEQPVEQPVEVPA